MNGQIFPELNERLNRDAHERLLNAAAESRRAHKAFSILRLFKPKKTREVPTIVLYERSRERKTSPTG